MEFASPVSWWLALAAAAGIVGLSYLAYRRPAAPLTTVQRGGLSTLRALALARIALLLLRPVRLLPPVASGDRIIPILVDTSRSMRLADADGEPRIARATGIVTRDLLPSLSSAGRVEILSAGDGLAPAAADVLAATGRKSDLDGAIAAAAERYRGQQVAGIIVISDGAATRHSRAEAASRSGPPIFAIGVGSPDGLPDREVLGVTAGEPKLDDASIDLHVSAASRGFSREPFTLRVSADGQLVESRRVTPAADGSPSAETFTVAPDATRASVYTVDIQADAADAVPENDRQSLLVAPTGRKRRVLALIGAPGYEHSFLLRALSQDSGLDLDAVVRKGKNESGTDTFLVQAGGGRGGTLTSGFPATKEALYGYDALIVANVEADFFTRTQLEMAAAFVAERGGGLLVMGGRSFERRGLIGSALEEALPLELNDRYGGTPRPATGEDVSGPRETISLTRDGETHPIMRLGATADESRKLWASLPPLAASAPVGGARPGATILAMTAGANGATPVIAVQRYGRGRSMIFGGEASWRWRMMTPATDRRYEFFWRQALRWLAAAAPDPVTIELPSSLEPGDPLTASLEVRDPQFAAVADATVSARWTTPGGESTAIAVRPNGGGRFSVTATPEAAGVYRMRIEARRGATLLGEADRWVYVGGIDRELAEPRLNEATLMRLASASGGRYVRAADAGEIVGALQSAVPSNLEPIRRDLWNRPWVFALVVLILAGEWVFRRRWGLR